MFEEDQFFNLFNLADSYKLQPIVKWAGGKEQELKYILPNLPKEFKDFYEPLWAEVQFIRQCLREDIILMTNLMNL